MTYLIETFDKPDHQAVRQALRPEHVDGVCHLPGAQ